MPKPAELPDWATDANYPADGEPEAGTPTKVAPVVAKQATGWRPSGFPTAQETNWLQNLVYQWLVYLSDQKWEGAIHETGIESVSVQSDTISATATHVVIELAEVTPEVYLPVVTALDDGRRISIKNMSPNTSGALRVFGTGAGIATEGTGGGPGYSEIAYARSCTYVYWHTASTWIELNGAG